MIKDIMRTLHALKESYKFKLGNLINLISLGIYQLNTENYPQYLEFRRKRLNITQVMLIDLLGCSISKIDDELLANIVNLGTLIELKAIALRDVNLAKPIYTNSI
jgi:hypothetical protein